MPESTRSPRRRPPSVHRSLLSSEAGGGIALMVAAAAALALANSGLAPAYFATLHAYLGSAQHPALHQRRPDARLLSDGAARDQASCAGTRVAALGRLRHRSDLRLRQCRRIAGLASIWRRRSLPSRSGSRPGCSSASRSALRSSWAAASSIRAYCPEHASFAQIYGVSLLCGIGFTMSLFIGLLAFPGLLRASRRGEDRGALRLNAFGRRRRACPSVRPWSPASRTLRT